MCVDTLFTHVSVLYLCTGDGQVPTDPPATVAATPGNINAIIILMIKLYNQNPLFRNRINKMNETQLLLRADKWSL